jgi:hypothetical protein
MNDENVNKNHVFSPLSQGMALVAAFILLTVIWMVVLPKYKHQPPQEPREAQQQENDDRTTMDEDAHARAMARQATLLRQSQHLRKRHNKQQRQQLIASSSLSPSMKSSWDQEKPAKTVAPELENQEILRFATPVLQDGITVFRILPELPESNVAADILREIAQDFLPIIRDRNYSIWSVSELCCCGDGLDYELGGNRHCWKMRPPSTRHNRGCEIEGHQQADKILGYNGIAHQPLNSLQYATTTTTNTIHLRLRSPQNHLFFREYQDIAQTMCHELAHCVFRNHESEFLRLEKEIEKEWIVRRSIRLAAETTLISS